MLLCHAALFFSAKVRFKGKDSSIMSDEKTNFEVSDGGLLSPLKDFVMATFKKVWKRCYYIFKMMAAIIFAKR